MSEAWKNAPAVEGSGGKSEGRSAWMDAPPIDETSTQSGSQQNAKGLDMPGQDTAQSSQARPAPRGMGLSLGSPAAEQAEQVASPTEQAEGIEASDYLKETAEGGVQGVGSAVGGTGDFLEWGGNLVESGLRKLGLGDVVDKGDQAISGMAPSDAFQAFESWMQEGAKEVDASQTEAFRQSMQGSTPKGDVFAPDTWSFGDDPSAAGYAGQMAGLIGQFAPQAATMLAGTPQRAATAMTLMGGAQAGGSQANEAEKRIQAMDENQLSEASGLYKDLRDQGVSHEDARDQTAKAAGAAAFVGGAPAGAAGGAVTSYVLGPLQRQLGGSLGGRLANSVALEGPAEATQEVSETMLARQNTNTAIQGDQDLDRGTFGDAVLGGMFGTGLGAAGALGGGRDATPPRTQNDAVRERTPEDIEAFNEQFEQDRASQGGGAGLSGIPGSEAGSDQTKADPEFQEGSENGPSYYRYGDKETTEQAWREAWEQEGTSPDDTEGSESAGDKPAGLQMPEDADSGQKTASVSTMMTNQMRQQLRDLGHSDEAIRKLRPQEAWDRIQEGRSTSEKVENAAKRTDTEPTPAQAEAGNYRKGRVQLEGLDIAIENPKGSTRRGTDEKGREWESQMAHHYGDIKGTTGADGDNLDVFVGDRPENGKAFIIDQVSDDGSFDEHKVMLGFDSADEAREGYLANYEEGWQGLGEISEVDAEALKSWMRDGDTQAPFSMPQEKATEDQGSAAKQTSQSGLGLSMDGAAGQSSAKPKADSQTSSQESEASSIEGDGKTSNRQAPTSRVPVDQIEVDPAEYQFRTEVNDEGVDSRLEGVERWDDVRAGSLMLHEREDGRLFAADGHHRLDLARRTGQQEVNAQILREQDGYSVADARREAAETNIADGNATASDAAKVFRNSEGDAGDIITERNLPRRSQVVRDGADLAKLSDEAFGAVLNNVVKEKDGAAIGRSFDDPEQQLAAIDAFKDVDPQNDNQRQLLTNEIRQAGFADSQGGLFGDDPMESLISERVKVMDKLRQDLVRDRRLFATLNNNADKAQRAGNRIATDQNEAFQDASARALDVLERATTTPEINQQINDAARRVNGGESVAKAAKELKETLLNGNPATDERQQSQAPDGEPDATAGLYERPDQQTSGGDDTRAEGAGEPRLDGGEGATSGSGILGGTDLSAPVREGEQRQEATETGRGATEAVNFKADGKPFPTRRAVQISKRYRDTPGAEPVEVEGGWGFRVPDATQSRPPSSQSEQGTARRGSGSSRITWKRRDGRRVWDGSDGTVIADHSIGSTKTFMAFADNAAYDRGENFATGDTLTEAKRLSETVERPRQLGVDTAQGADSDYETYPDQPSEGVDPAPQQGGGIDAPNPRPSRSARSSEPTRRQRRSAEELGGIAQGDTIELDTDVGYARAGGSYRVGTIQRDGRVRITNTDSGASTILEREDIAAASQRSGGPVARRVGSDDGTSPDSQPTGRSLEYQSVEFDDAPLLETQTEADLAQRENEVRQAETDRRRQEEERAQADAEVDDFRLTGSDSDADIAASYGQGDLMGATPDIASEAPEVTAGSQEVSGSAPDIAPEAPEVTTGTQGIGVSAPDTSTESLRGRASAKGLDMSQEGRMQRAHDMGYISAIEDVIKGEYVDGQITRVDRGREATGGTETEGAERSADLGRRSGEDDLQSRDAGRDGASHEDSSRGRGPLTVYHGTAGDVASFVPGHPGQLDSGWLGEGVYLTTDRRVAEHYASRKAHRQGGNGGETIMPLHIRPESLLRVPPTFKRRLSTAGPEASEAFSQWVRKQGYDGVVTRYGDAYEVAMLDPTKVRSTQAAFDPGGEGDSDLLFSAGTEQPLAPPDVDAVRAELETMSDLLGDVEVIDHPRELPPHVLMGMTLQGINPQDVRGMFSGNRLYVIASNNDGLEEAVRAAVHEAVGHKGIHGVLGEELEPVMRQFFRRLPHSKIGRQARDEVKRDYPFLDWNDPDDQITVAEEMVAHLIEKGHRPAAWQRAVAKIKELLRRYFPSVPWTTADALNLGEKSRDYLRRKQAEADGDTPETTTYAMRRRQDQSRVSESFSDLNADQAEALDMIGPLGAAGSAMAKVRQVWDRAGVKMRAGIFDKFAALKALDEQVHGKDFIENSTASSSWILARMAPAAQGALNTLIHNGRIQLNSKEKVIELKDGADGGLQAVLAQLGDAEEVTRFMGWIAGNRAEKLREEGRENYFEERHIQGLTELNSGRAKNGEARRTLYPKVFEQFQAIRDDVLSIAEQSGLLRRAMSQPESALTIARQRGAPDEIVDQLKRAETAMNQEDGDLLDQGQAIYNAASERLQEWLWEQAQQDVQPDALDTAQQRYDSALEEWSSLQRDQREIWAEEFYVPFYRVLDENTNDVQGPASTAGLSRQRAYQRLKGADMRIGDLLENTLMNYHHLLSASLKNQAAMQAIDNAEQLGVAHEVSESNRDPRSSTFILRNGQQAYYEISDDLVYKALVNMTDAGMQALLNSSAMKVMRWFKRVLTNTTTVTPGFVAANTLRDSIQSAAVTPAGLNPAWNAVRGTAHYANKENRAQMIASGASFNFGHLYGDRADELKAQLRRNLKNAKVVNDPGTARQAVKWSWRRWNDVTDFAENVNRAKVYQANLDKGKLYAAFQSRDLMDFSSHGSWFMTRFLIETVPFLNARIQGADKLYRDGFKPSLLTMFGKGSDSDKQRAKRFSVVTGAYMAASIGLFLHNEDDEDYQALPDWQKDTYSFFKFGDQAFFMPKPFEVGAVATMGERITEQFISDEAGGDLLKERLWHMLTQTFAFSPVPQAAAPVLDVYANRDPFRNRPIEPYWDKQLSPSLRFRSSTTMQSRFVSKGLEGAFGSDSVLSLSPLQLDYLVNSYFGTVGSYAMGMADTMWRNAMGVESPASYWTESKPIRRFYRNLNTPAYYTRYQSLFYEGLEEVNRVYGDLKQLEKMGAIDEAREKAQNKGDMLRLRKQLNDAQRHLSDVSQRMDQIKRSTDMDADYKRRELERLRTMRNRITEVLGKEVEKLNAGG
ncbi:LPD38 domain-containing protein [Halomonas sp. I1]|uniref:LPD38 domain-containing protein n=1 Tax=Halomonas sp. I1 TaxID=393536 RepID=UPI0028DFC5B4|nr:LPD38 domain-containing protein [Halomonas sp. I1]MDT8895624.1 LPD38 domain-containing protein [Halomonas sp. I1]